MSVGHQTARGVPPRMPRRCYSTTSSAIASTPDGMVMPSVATVLRLTSSSILVGRSTGEISGLRVFEDTARIDAHLAVRIRNVGSVADPPICYGIKNR